MLDNVCDIGGIYCLYNDRFEVLGFRYYIGNVIIWVNYF